MMFYNETRSKTISDMGSMKDIIKSTEEIFSEHWLKNVSYGMHRLETMKSKPIGLSIKMASILGYLKAANEVLDMGRAADDISIADEVMYWERESGYCIYMSVLFKLLMEQIEKKEAAKIHYFQGTSTLLTEDAMARMVFGEKQIGIHAWLVYEGAVLDITSLQHKHSIRFPKNSFNMVIGEIPQNYILQGFKENEKTVQGYKEKFAEHASMSVEEWTKWHVDAYVKFKELNK